MNQRNLKGIYKELWVALETAIVDRKSDFHTFSLATVNNEIADNRTVVLRGCNKNKMILSFNTNNSSDKIAHISKNNNVSALFYDKDAKTQIRIIGKAVINNNNDYCKDKWGKMSKQSRECYFQTINPGKTIEHPYNVTIKYNQKMSENFTIIDINILRIDWLYLSASGHSRAKYTKENNYEGEWIAP